MQILELWRYPVKSVGGERVAVARMNPTGIEGDRGWGIRDLKTSMTLTARRTPELLFASAAYHGSDEVSITLPDGTETSDSAVLSSWLKKDVELVGSSDVGGTYECPIDPDLEQQWVQWQGPAGSFHDSAKSRVSVVSEASLGDWDLRRFRTNILTSGSGEDAWVDRAVRIGAEVELQVMKQIDRCVMISRPQPGLERDLDLLKFINAERGTFLSIGALITADGIVSEGDTVSVVEE